MDPRTVSAKPEEMNESDWMERVQAETILSRLYQLSDNYLKIPLSFTSSNPTLENPLSHHYFDILRELIRNHGIQILEINGWDILQTRRAVDIEYHLNVAVNTLLELPISHLHLNLGWLDDESSLPEKIATHMRFYAQKIRAGEIVPFITVEVSNPFWTDFFAEFCALNPLFTVTNATLALARLTEVRDETDKARDIYTKLIDDNPEFIEALYLRALLLEKIAKKETDGEARKELLQEAVNDLDDAVENFKKLPPENQDSFFISEMHFLSGQLSLKLSKPMKALRDLSAVEIGTPHYENARLLLQQIIDANFKKANILFDSNELTKALTLYSTLITFAGHIDSLYQRALICFYHCETAVLLKMPRFNQSPINILMSAIHDLERILKNIPSYPGAEILLEKSIAKLAALKANPDYKLQRQVSETAATLFNNTPPQSPDLQTLPPRSLNPRPQ